MDNLREYYMKRLIFIFLLCITNITLAKMPEEMVEAFLSKVDHAPREALDEIIKNGPLDNPRLQTTMRDLGIKIPLAMQIIGEKIETPPEKIKESNISDSMKRLIYVQKYEIMPMVWYFNFYKARNNWTLQAIYFNTEIPTTL